MKQRFLQGAAYSTGSMIFSTLALLVAGKLMTNALAPAMVGQVALLLILGELLGTLCNLGLTAALPKLLPACDDAGRARLLGTLLPFQACSGLVMAVVCGAAAMVGPWWRPFTEGLFPLSPPLFMLAPMLVVVVTLRGFLLAAAAGLHAYGLRAGAIVLMSTLQATSFALLYVLGARQPVHFALAYIASGVIGTTLLTRIVPRPLHWDGALVREQVRFSAPLYANTLLGFAYQRLDTVIVVYFLGMGSAAVFEMAKRIPGVLGRFLGAGLVPYLPSIAGLLRDSGPEGAGTLLQRAAAYTTFTGYLATLVVVAIQEPLLAVLFTTDYQDAAPAVGPLLIAACLATQAGLMGQALIALERPVLVMNINMGLAVLGIGLNLILIPHFGLAGAGWSAASAAWLSYMLQRAAVARAGLPLARPGAVWISLAFVLAYGFAWWMDAVFWTLVTATGYGLACLAAGSVSLQELRALLRKEEGMILGIDGRLANAKHPAGAGHYCREVLRALGKLDAGLWLRVYLDDEPVPELPVRRDRIRILPRGALWTHRILAKELRSHPPDVFFSPVAQLPWRCPCPSLVTVLDLAAWSHPSFFPWRKRITMKIQARHAVQTASHIVAISQATASDLSRRFSLSPEQISVAPLGCGDRFFNPGPLEPGTILSALPDSYVLYLGQVQPRKNLLRLFAAFERVMKAHPALPHHLVLAGGLGWQNEAIYRAAEASPMADRILFFDYLPDALVPAMIAGADVLALVSLWEGFGLPALEAMAAGTAVLASDCSSLPEVVGDAGVLVAPEDVDAIAEGLTRLLLDDGLRAECEKKGRERARLFRWEETARVILDAAKALMD